MPHQDQAQTEMAASGKAGRKALGLSSEETKAHIKHRRGEKCTLAVTKELKKRCVDMLQAAEPTTVIKENAFSKLATKLLERELQERADPALAAKRVLKCTPLEDLAEPRKRARGQRSSGECLSAAYCCMNCLAVCMNSCGF